MEWLLELGGTKKDIALLGLSGAALLLSMTKALPLPFDLVWAAILLCGIPILAEAVIGLVTSFDIKADVLVSLALVASVLVGEYFAAGEVAFIMRTGGLLEDLTVAKARAGIEKLVCLTPQTARRITTESGEDEILPASQVKPGDLLRILPGETIPVDGVILSGQTSVNQAVMTGESIPADKAAGDEVFSGTVNQFGAFEMKAVRAGEDSSIQRMIRLVQSADADKAKIVGLADRWATWIVVAALAGAAVTWAVSGEIIRAVTILVVFCPCSLVLATPTAIMAAIGNATRHGFLVKEGDALERLASVSRITFDKTGTLTCGKLEVSAVKSVFPGWSDQELYCCAASAESCSEHPLGKAVACCYQAEGGQNLYPVSNFQMIPGQGISAKLNSGILLAGNEKLLESGQIRMDKEEQKDIAAYRDRGCTAVLVAFDGRYAGYLALADAVRRESAAVIEDIKALEITPVLLTGDNERVARTVAFTVGIVDVHASCLPESKMERIRQYQQEGHAVCMIGDGINDAPALKTANVGIAMGGIGSDIAVSAADIVLVNDEIRELPHLLALSRRMMTVIKYNLSFSIGLNFLAAALAAAGILNPVTGALIHNCGSVLVILHSALLMRWENKGRKTVLCQNAPS